MHFNSDGLENPALSLFQIAFKFSIHFTPLICSCLERYHDTLQETNFQEMKLIEI